VYEVEVIATAFNLPRAMFALMPVSSPSTTANDSSSVFHSGLVSRNARTLGAGRTPPDMSRMPKRAACHRMFGAPTRKM
jgi:hypothetical protein